jgi:hypothetical protein
LVWFGLVWFGLVWFGLVWFGLVLELTTSVAVTHAVAHVLAALKLFCLCHLMSLRNNDKVELNLAQCFNISGYPVCLRGYS